MTTKTEISVSLPTRLAGEIAIRLYDPGLGKPAYGARSALIVKLLETWLEKEKEHERNNTPDSSSPDDTGNAGPWPGDHDHPGS